MSLLPQKLVRGRAYFIDDEQVIVVDHGKGPVIYGGKPGPQGQAGEPLPQLQDQIDNLAAAELLTQENIWRLTERSDKKISGVEDNLENLAEETSEKFSQTDTRISHEAQIAKDYTDALEAQTEQKFIQAGQDLAQVAQSAKDYTDSLHNLHTSDVIHLENLISDSDSHLQSQVDNQTSAILSLIMTVQEKFTSYDNALAIITKAISNLYPAPYAEETQDPLDGETLSTDAGTWTIQQTILDDGMIVCELEAQSLLIETLQVGDKVDYDGSTWTVKNYSVSDGMITVELTP